MTEYEASEPATLPGAKKIWATPEIRDQSIKSATTKGKNPTPVEYNATTGHAS